MWCRCINSLHNVFTYQCLKKETRRINYKPKLSQNAALQLNGMHLSSPSTECWTALSGCKQLRHGLGGQCLCEVARSLAYPLDNDLAMMTRPVLAKPFKAWSMIVMPIPVYDILISSQSCHSSAPNWHALNYRLAYTMTDTYWVMVS